MLFLKTFFKVLKDGYHTIILRNIQVLVGGIITRDFIFVDFHLILALLVVIIFNLLYFLIDFFNEFFYTLKSSLSEPHLEGKSSINKHEYQQVCGKFIPQIDNFFNGLIFFSS